MMGRTVRCDVNDIDYPGTSLERREQELSFDTKLDEISGFIVEDIGSFKSVRIYLTDPVCMHCMFRSELMTDEY